MWGWLAHAQHAEHRGLAAPTTGGWQATDWVRGSILIGGVACSGNRDGRLEGDAEIGGHSVDGTVQAARDAGATTYDRRSS